MNVLQARIRNRAAELFSATCPAPARSGAVSFGSDQMNEPALGVRIAIDVDLGRLDRPMASKQLDIAKTAAGLVNRTGSVGDEGASPGVRGTSLQTELSEHGAKPVHQRVGAKVPAACRPDDRAFSAGLSPKRYQGCTKVWVHGHATTGPLLGNTVDELDLS